MNEVMVEFNINGNDDPENRLGLPQRTASKDHPRGSVSANE